MFLNLLLLPEIILVLGSFFVLLLGVFKENSYKILNFLVLTTLLIIIFFLIFQFNEKKNFFSNFYNIDPFVNFIKLLILGSIIFTLLLTKQYLEKQNLLKFEFLVIILLSAVGMFVMVSASNLIVFYLGLELQSLCLYIMASINTKSSKSSESGLKYFVLGSLASGLLLYGCSIVYGFSGTLNYTEISKFSSTETISLKFGLVFILCGIAFKVSAVPFHMWTPDVYEGSPTAVTTFFAIAPKVAAIAAFVKFLNVPYINYFNEWKLLLLILSCASMFLGAVAAIAQSNLKRLMAYSSISHVGFILAGVTISTPEALNAVVIYTFIYVIMNIGIFSCILALKRKENYYENIFDLSGISKNHPLLALSFTILLFSLAGIPPLAGFFAKLYIFLAIIEQKMFYFAAFGLICAVIAGFYYLRLIKIIYFDPPKENFDQINSKGLKISIILSTLIVLLFFIQPSFLTEITSDVIKYIK
ncbi:MAG: NADH-quinone oxidoreductase subunit NuoN [Candidatus Fonsibacter sp.]